MTKFLGWRAFVPITLLALALVACGAGSTGTPASAPTQSATPSSLVAQKSEPDIIRFALLPILDVLPFHVAEQNGYFEKAGIQVEPVPVKSAQERDTLMQTGQIDGMLAEPLAAALFNQDEPLVKVVRTARQAYSNSPLFRILAAPGSDIDDPADLADVEIGISQNTVIEYITDRILENAGVPPDQIASQEVSAIPVRFELLINGEILAATLPDPLASGAMAAGAVLVVDDTSVPDLSQSILAFSTDALQAKPEAVRRFLEAWEMAVEELNANPEAYHDLLIEEGRVPESIQGTFQMPPYPEATVPTPQQIADVVSWALERGLIDSDVPFERIVDERFLP